MGETAWRDRVDVRTTLRRYVLAALARMDRPPAAAKTVKVGPRPIRILVVGGGTAVSHGVRTSEHGLDGAVADAVHEATGQGVIVLNQAAPTIRLREVAASMGASRAHTFDLLVWSPTYVEVVERLGMRGWRRDLAALVDDVQTESPVRTVLLLLPHIEGRSANAVLARRWLPRIDRAIEEAAAASPRTTTASVEPVELAPVGEVVLDRDYYARCAERLLPVLPGREVRRTAR